MGFSSVALSFLLLPGVAAVRVARHRVNSSEGYIPTFLRPRLIEDKRDVKDPDSYYPSWASYRSSTPTIRNFEDIDMASTYTGDKKILVIASSKYLLEMANGVYFDTGHQASETLVPMYHMGRAGFEFDIATPGGFKMALEEWTFGMATGYEDRLREIRATVQSMMDNPLKLSDVPLDLAPYAAIFFPGGHGPLIEMHKTARVGELLRSAHQQNLPTISLCHGPSAFRAAALQGTADYPYKGYKICVFPDKVDMETPKYGYLPGFLKEEDKCEAKLKELGVEVVNTEMDDSVVTDRELVTGASQAASQTLSVAAVKLLAERYGFELRA
jgi:molecular chaperone Hsp31 and glyoxalase 3